MGRRRPSPSQTWRTFLANHVGQVVAVDFFVVPTVTYRLLFVLVMLAHDRRRIVHVADTAHPTSAWTYVERLIGSIRRECLDHVIVLTAARVQRVVTAYVAYYMRSRTHLGLDKDSPTPRPVMPTVSGPIVAVPEVNGLHHRYDRAAASSPLTFLPPSHRPATTQAR